MNFFSPLLRRVTAPCSAALLGAAFFFLMYGQFFSPTYEAWILTDGWDTIQHHLGWEFFRHTPWTFPLGNNLFYGYPVGVPVIYSDSIPLLAIPFKLVNHWLPADFQYLGLWFLLCYILQGLCGYFVCKHFLKNELLSLLGSIFFIASPIMMFRIAGHAALAAHWVVLLGLILLLKMKKYFQWWQWGSVLILSILVHPYLFVMVTILMLADSLRLFSEKIIAWREFIAYISMELLGIFALMWTIGYFWIGTVTAQATALYSMHWTAFFNPLQQRWSHFLPTFLVGPYQYEGFSYLGLGIFFLIAITLAIMRLEVRSWWVTHVPTSWHLIALAAVFFFIAIGDATLLFVPVIGDVFSILRANGRFIWPVYYLIMPGVFSIVCFMRPPIAFAVLTAALIIQIADISPALISERSRHRNQQWQSPLQSSLWKDFARQYRHVSFVGGYHEPDKEDIAQSKYLPIAWFAAKNGLSINDGYYARPIKGRGAHIREELAAIKRGEIDRNTLYIFSGSTEKFAQDEKIKKNLQVVDGYRLLAP